MMTGASRARFESIVRCFPSRSVLVIGDLMVDEYLRGTARRISPESPVMVIEVETDEFKPGGAANVVNNLRALGAHTAVVGIVGDDEGGRLLRMELGARGVDVSGIVTDPTRPTTRKTRIVAQNQQVLRVDREQTRPISPEAEQRLLHSIEEALKTVDAALVSDYQKGVFTPELARGLVEKAAEAGKPLIANLKPSSARWLHGARALSLNLSEAEAVIGERLPEEEAAFQHRGALLAGELGARMLVITRGGKGLSYWGSDGTYEHVPAHPVEVYDVAGAGDSTISALALALISGATDAEAASLANYAGACVVRRSGVATVTTDELLGSL